VLHSAAKAITNKVAYNPFYNIYTLAAGLATISKSLILKPNLIHITQVEDNLGILTSFGKNISNKIMGTVHNPVSLWKLIHHRPEFVSELDALIVLSNEQLDYFEFFLSNKVYFIPHGVDTNIFLPKNKQLKNGTNKILRCIYTGKWLRDTIIMA